MSIHLSVIICTCNRADHLASALGALEGQREACFEVIVVNGPSTDHTRSVLDQWAGRIKVTHYDRRFISASRNRGVAMAAGDLLVFLDDDARPFDPFWLYRYARAYESDASKTIGAWGGEVIDGSRNAVEFAGGQVADYGFLCFHPQWTRPPRGRHWHHTVCGANMAFRRDALQACGGFDERFIYYAEETDLVLRLAARGWQTVHLAGNAVLHYPDRNAVANPLASRPWTVISRSDMLFALRHGRDRLPVRVYRAWRYARQKHFFQECQEAESRGTITRRQARRIRRRCLLGRCQGALQGLLTRAERVDFGSSPPPFHLFSRS